MSDTSTAQPNWLGISNPLSVNSLSAKEFVELPLLSTYNNAFLETITEEGSEFEPSEDGSASFEHSDYLPFESVRVEQATSSLVRVDPTLMIGELDSPDYEEVFPMPIQSLPTFRRDLLNYSNLFIPFTKANGLETTNLKQPAEKVSQSDPVGQKANKDFDTLRFPKNPVEDVNKKVTNTDDPIKTSDYQSYDEADLPVDETDDGWGDRMMLDLTPGRTGTIKRMAPSEATNNTTHSRIGCDASVEPMDTHANSFSPWTDDSDGKSEDMLVLSTEGDDKKLVWKLQSTDQSVGVRNHPVTPPPVPITFPAITTVPNNASSISPAKNYRDRLEKPMGTKLVETKTNSNEVTLALRNNTTNALTALETGDTTKAKNGAVVPPRLTIPQAEAIPAVPRPILPRFCDSTLSKPWTTETEMIPPPKPYFPRHGFPELLLNQTKPLQNSTRPTPAPSVVPTRPPIPPRPNTQPVNTIFPPTLSYRELLYTTHAKEPTKIPKSQSLHSTCTFQTFQPTYPLTEAQMKQSATDSSTHHGVTFNSNLETLVNPMTSSYLNCHGKPLFNPQSSYNPQTSCPTFVHSFQSPQVLSRQTAHALSISGWNNALQNQDDNMFENPAYTSSFIPKSSPTSGCSLAKRSESPTNAASPQVPFKSRPNQRTGQSVGNPFTLGTSTGKPIPVRTTSSSSLPPEDHRHSEKPDTANKTPSNSSTVGSQPNQSPLWIANSTPLAHYYASHSAMQEQVSQNDTCKPSKLAASEIPQNRLAVSEEMIYTTSAANKKPNRTGSETQPVSSTNLNPNPRPIQRSFAVVGVSDLLAKTDEELNRFMRNTDKRKPDIRMDLTDELSTESSGNQHSSISGGPIEHSPVRRRFQSNRVGPVLNMRFADPVETESDSEHLDRRSFYDYGCDDDEDEEEEELDANDLDAVVSDSELDTVRRNIAGRPLPKVVTPSGTDEILRQLSKLNQNTQFVWSDSCHATTNAQDRKSIKELDEILSQWDVPFIDSDSFLNEPWNSNSEAWRLSNLRKPIRANLDEVTLTSDRTSSKMSWGSTNALNYATFSKETYHRRGSRNPIENDYDDVSPEDDRKHSRTRSRRGFHSCDSSTQSKHGSRLQKITAPWLQRLCGCVRPSRFRRKKSV